MSHAEPLLRLLLADDHPVARRGLKSLLQDYADLEVVGEAEDGLEAVELTKTLQPDVAVLDVRMPAMDGIRACRQIKVEVPQTQILILSAYSDDRYVFGLLEAGATGYILKDAADSEIIQAIRAAGQREPYLTPRIRAKASAQAMRATTHVNELTPRELDVLALMATAMDNIEIGERLFLSKVTVQNYTSSIYSKLDVNTRAKAILYAIQYGLVEPGEEAD